MNTEESFLSKLSEASTPAQLYDVFSTFVRESKDSHDSVPQAGPSKTPIRKTKHAIHDRIAQLFSNREYNLWLALHSVAGSLHRWDKDRARGLSDDELRARIGEEFGLSGGSSNPDGTINHSYRGGKNPAFWLEHAHLTKKPDLHGGALVKEARLILAIPKQESISNVGERQLSLF